MSKITKAQKIEYLRMKSSQPLLEKRIAALEADKQAGEKKLEEAAVDAAVDQVLSDFSFESPASRDLARNAYRLQVQRDPDTNELCIGARKVEDAIRSELPAKFPFLLEKKDGGIKPKGGRSLADLMDNITPSSSADDKAEASRRLAVLLN